MSDHRGTNPQRHPWFELSAPAPNLDGVRITRPVTCHEDMGADPCGQPAVALRLDPEHGDPYPVCEEHDRP